MRLSSWFESSVNSYDSQTINNYITILYWFESSVNSYDSQTDDVLRPEVFMFESSVNSYDSQTVDNADQATISLRVV